MFRKMKPGEEKIAAEILAEAFIDYPLHRELLKNCTHYRHHLTEIMLFYVSSLSNSVYLNDEMTFVACLEKPEDNNPPFLSRSTLRLTREIFRDCPLRARVQMIKYLIMAEELAKKYKQEGDCYLHHICTVGTACGSGIIFRFFMEVLGNRPFVCETHTERNRRLYERMGMVVCETKTWHNLHHCFLRRPENADCNYESAIAERAQR